MHHAGSFLGAASALAFDAAAIAAAAAAAFAAHRCAFAAVRLRPSRWRVPDRPMRAALTFDDGPDPANTPGVLEDLAAAGVKATFFVLGERVRAHEALVRDMAAAGHDVQVHGWVHRLSLCQRAATLGRHLTHAVSAIEHATRVRPTFYRPPFGMLAPAAARAARDRGLTPHLWSGWARDWRLRRPSDMVASLDGGLLAGAVLLLHDGEGTGGTPGAVQNMRLALRPFVASALERGWTFESLRSLVGSG